MNSNMTKKQKLRQNRFAADFGGKEDDFILADLDVMLDEEELSPVPLNHFLDDEETIDRLLINSGFEANDELEEDDRESPVLVIDDVDLADDFSSFDPFVVEPVEQAEQNRHRETEKISPLNFHLVTDSDEIPDEEDAIDRLLVDAGFDFNDDLEQDNGKTDTLGVDDIGLVDDLPGIDQFVVEPVELTEQNPLTETEEISVSDIHSRVDFDEIPDEEDDIDRLLIDAGFDANDELKEDDGALDAPVIDDTSRANEYRENFEEQNTMAADAGIFDAEESELALDKDATTVFLVKEENPETVKRELAISETTYLEEAFESLNNDAGVTTLSSVRSEQDTIKKQINDYENKVKKANIIAFSSLSLGIIALLSTVVMGVIVSSVQTKVSKLTELVSILEEDMSSIAERNSDMEINNSDLSSEQLYQKVNGIPEQSEQQTPFSSGMLEREMKAVVTKRTSVNKTLDNPKIRTPALENKKLSEATVEKISTEKKVKLQKHWIEQSQSSADLSKSNMTAVAKKQAVINKSIDNRKTKTYVVEKKKPSETTVKMTSAKKKTNNAQAAADWSVNLTAYQDLSYAKSKAVKFLQKGIPVKVIGFDMNNTTWYRLKVGGFKNKEEATSYAAKIKKSLNLNTVSVGNI
jgi:cell division protein FtsN